MKIYDDFTVTDYNKYCETHICYLEIKLSLIKRNAVSS